MMRKLLLVLVALLMGLVILGIWLPDQINASHSTLINASPEQVFQVVSDLETLPAWSPWDDAAQADDYTFSEPSEGLGAWASWGQDAMLDSAGDVRIVEVSEGQKLSLQVDFDEAGGGEWTIRLRPEQGATRLEFEYSASLTEGAGPLFGLLLRYGRPLVVRSAEEALARGLQALKDGFDAAGRWQPGENA